MPKYNKITLLPLHSCDWELRTPLPIAADLTVESVEGLLRLENFDLWRDYVSKKDRDALSSAKFGILHRFFSEGHIGKEEAASQDKIYKTFLLLRLIRPNRLRYSNVQIRINTEQPVFGFTQPAVAFPNAPGTQVLNLFHQEHFQTLSQLFPKFLSFVDSAPRNLIRAIRLFEMGYSDIGDAAMQFVAWTIGIESCLSQDTQITTNKELALAIQERIGAQTNIYSEAESVGVGILPTELEPVLIKDVVGDILEARNRFVHGVGVPQSFDERSAKDPVTGDKVHYVDVLREGASFILRKLILRAVGEFNV